jgi:hypothetical protein
MQFADIAQLPASTAAFRAGEKVVQVLVDEKSGEPAQF